jgi:hypothetical protein
LVFWVRNKTYSPEEISIRFKYRIVSIHCFPNGNGRHSRLMEREFAIGIGAIIVGLLIISSYDGPLIDFTQKRFKEYLSIGSYKFGEWVALPDIIKVISTSYIRRNTPNGISPTLSGKVTDFKTLIYSNSPKPEFSLKYSNMDKAVKHARRLAADLNADLILNIPERD